MIFIIYGLIVVMVLMSLLVISIYCLPEQLVKRALNTTRKHAGLTRKELKLNNDLDVVYLEGGTGAPLILLHGFGGNKDTFVAVARYLTKQYRVIIPDIIGFGESARPSTIDYTPEAQVERLKQFCDALKLESVHLGGNSMGGQIALLYAARFQGDVKSLWLLSPAGVWSVAKSDIIQKYIDTGKNELIAKDEIAFKKVMALGMKKPPYIPKPMLSVLAQERIQNAELEETIFQGIMESSIEDEIKDIKVPTLIVFGESDCIIPLETAKILEGLLVNSRTINVPNIGHVPMFESPKQCARDYTNFRQSLV